ncbi:MAG: L-lactate dehydrogenase [Pseudomonadales bacterium]
MFSQTPITQISDLAELHRRRVPRMFYDYAASGSWTESTLRGNSDAFSRLQLNQRVAVNLEQRSITSTMLGESWSMPVALAPVGLTGMQHADGEIHAALAAEQANVPYCLSTMSICSIEDVAAATSKPFWFQLYVMRDRDFVKALMDRAREAGCSALVLTLDLQILGQRHQDIKNGLSTPPKPTLRNLANIATKPRWAWEMLGTKRRGFGNIEGHVKGVEDMSSLSSWTASQFDPALSWDDVAWIRDYWGGKLILKGIMDPRDAALAAATQADAIVVSNHGGRQLDGAPATLDALPGIVDAVAGRCEVWLDGGIRSGQDVLKALALGADATMIGRAYIHGLGAMGQQGVAAALAVIANELDLTMAFCGITDITKVDAQVLWNNT